MRQDRRACGPAASGSRTKCAEQSKLVSSHLCGLSTKLSAVLDALDHPALLLQQQRAAGPGGIDVQIEVVRAADLGDRAQRIDRADAGSAEAGDHAGRHAARARGRRGSRPRAGRGACANSSSVGIRRRLAAAEARDRDRLLDRGVGLLGGVEGERRAGAEPFLVGAPAGRPLARAQDRAQRGAGRAVLDHAGEAFGQADHLAQPVEDAGLHLGRRGRGLPQHALGAERGGQHLGEHRGRARVGREVGEEAPGAASASCRAARCARNRRRCRRTARPRPAALPAAAPRSRRAAPARAPDSARRSAR